MFGKTGVVRQKKKRARQGANRENEREEKRPADWRCTARGGNNWTLLKEKTQDQGDPPSLPRRNKKKRKTISSEEDKHIFLQISNQSRSQVREWERTRGESPMEKYLEKESASVTVPTCN